VLILTNLQLELSHASFKFDKLHVQRGLLTSQRRDLLLDSRVLGLLVCVVPLHLFFNFKVFIGQCFADFLGLQSEYALQCLLFGSKHLHLAFMVVQLFSQRFDQLFE
jgi:hypothetical protein